MDWNLFAWVKRGSKRKIVLETIQKSTNPLTTNEIKIICLIPISQCSLLVKQLEEKELIQCLNSNDKIGKLYKMTKLGNEVLNEVNLK